MTIRNELIDAFEYLVETINTYLWGTPFRIRSEVQHTHTTIALK